MDVEVSSQWVSRSNGFYRATAASANHPKRKAVQSECKKGNSIYAISFRDPNYFPGMFSNRAMLSIERRKWNFSLTT